MRTFLLRTILTAALAYAPNVLAQSIGDWCKNHYILRPVCAPCPSEVSVAAPTVFLDQGSKTLVVGSEHRYGALGTHGLGLNSLAIVRLDPSAGPLPGVDRTWGDCGIARIPIWGAEDEARAVALQPDGKVLVLGTALDPTEFLDRNWDYMLEPHSYLAVIRLNDNGTLDRTFANNGRLVFRVGRVRHSEEWDVNSRASGLEVLADSTIRVILSYPGSTYVTPVARIRPDGTIEAVEMGAPERVAVGLQAAIEFINAGGDYYLTSDPDEIVMFDLSSTWWRTWRAFAMPYAEQP
jgi:hypothetical protein